MKERRKARWAWILGLLLAAGCATQKTGVDGQVHIRSDQLPQVYVSGFAIAPVGSVNPVVNAAEVAAFLSNNLYTALLVSLEGTKLIGPEHFLNQLHLYEDEGIDAFRTFRRRRVLGVELEKDECTRMSQMLLHRYVLVTWVEEKEAQVLEDYGQDYIEATHAHDVRRVSLTELQGELYGNLVDLWEAEVLWSGRADYRSQQVHLQAIGAQEELERARVQGVLNYVRLLQSQ